MKFTETELKGAYIVEFNKIEDERGFFSRSWCKKEMEEHGLNSNVVQSNTSFSKKKGTIRGMHYQLHPFEETKLMRCTQGEIFDVIVDLRKDSPTFLKWIGIKLSSENHKMVYVPENFAHGFVTLTDNAEVTYLVTQFYTPGAEAGIRYNDKQLNIEWPVPIEIVSDKDRQHPDFNIDILP